MYLNKHFSSCCKQRTRQAVVRKGIPKHIPQNNLATRHPVCHVNAGTRSRTWRAYEERSHRNRARYFIHSWWIQEDTVKQSRFKSPQVCHHEPAKEPKFYGRAQSQPEQTCNFSGWTQSEQNLEKALRAHRLRMPCCLHQLETYVITQASL